MQEDEPTIDLGRDNRPDGTADIRQGDGARRTEVQPTLPVGESEGVAESVSADTRSFGDYELISEIARGGMGVVYRARQLSLNREVALKMILTGAFAGEEQIRRFQIEAESAANLDHPGIVPIYEIGQHENQHFFAMKLIDGQSLSKLTLHNPMEAERAVPLVREIAKAVHHAHQRGILHRDLKPANILMDGDGSPVVTDFGLARQADATQADDQSEMLTQAGVVVGTPGFMSPEQASGTTVTTATDIYSLGAILYNLLSGETPHQGDSLMATVLSVINDPPTPLSTYCPDVDRDLELICLKCLSRDPEERYASADEFADELQCYLDGRPLRVRPPSLVELTRMWLASNYGTIVWVPVIAFLIGATAGLSIWLATAGGDIPSYRGAYERFPADRRPLLLFSWVPPRQLGFALFCVVLASIGWWTARLVQTKNRTADLSAGLSVGLLAGFVLLIAGYIPLSIFAGRLTVLDDLAILRDLASVDEAEAMLSLEMLYPQLRPESVKEAANLLYTKARGDLMIGTLSNLWIATATILIACGAFGALQTWIAGPLLRRWPRWRARISYVCFATGLVTLFFPFWCEVVIRMQSGGFGYMIDFTLPLVGAVISASAIIAVIKHLPLWLQVGSTTLSIASFGYFLFFSFLVVPPPAFARLRQQISMSEAAVEHFPRKPAHARHLAELRQQFGALLSVAGYQDRAEGVFHQAQSALDGIEEDDAPQETAKQRVTINLIAAVTALRHGLFDTSIEWIERIDALPPDDEEFEKEVAEVTAQVYAVAGNEQKLIDLIGDVDPGKRAPVWQAYRQIEEAANSRRQIRGLTDQETEDWKQSLIAKINFTDDSANIDRENSLQWMKSMTRWQLYGPYPFENVRTSAAFEKSYGPEKRLLDPTTFQQEQPAKTLSVHAHGTVDLLRELHHGNDIVAYAACEFHVEKSGRIKFLFRSDDGIRVWIDSKLVHSNQVNRGMWNQLDQLDLELEAGSHRMLLRVDQGEKDWGFMVDAVSPSWRLLPIWSDEGFH